MISRARSALFGVLFLAACETKPAARDSTPRDSAPRAADSTRAEFRAVGNEPGWLLVIGDSVATLEWDYGEKKASATTTPAESMPGGRRYSFAGATAFSVVVRDTSCADGMSGREFPARVSVTIGTRVLDGCGGTPSAMPPGTQ